jgi:putative FmdB family regulatory protein
MPIYEYRCSGCGHQQEYIQKVNDPQHTQCPACGKETFSKMLSAAGFQLKGSCWYATDFKGSGSKPASKPADASASGSKPAETKTESKTESKAESKPASSTGTTGT